MSAAVTAAALDILYPRQNTPSRPNNNDFNNARNTAKGISVAIIVVIVIAVVATIGGSILAIFCFMRHRRKQREVRDKFGGGIGAFNYPPSQSLNTAGGVGDANTGNQGGFTDPPGANPYGYNNYNQGPASQPPGYSEVSQGVNPPAATHTTPGHY
ncbi:hypothetical protein AAF712_007688 [Marasmius tenuissimus]|uniref:Uncharacterized protein n=1 Tax=Marasmius tenuissimus TaxID=585030 RepID=A0ABR2ZX19_9AGAR|nr:hypothetical protein PM082_024718 [Marasmius tenuissimus]